MKNYDVIVKLKRTNLNYYKTIFNVVMITCCQHMSKTTTKTNLIYTDQNYRPITTGIFLLTFYKGGDKRFHQKNRKYNKKRIYKVS